MTPHFPVGSLSSRARAGEGSVEFWFVCGLCEADCCVYCERTGFWNNRFEDPGTFWCWNCGEENTTPPGPWTPWED